MTERRFHSALYRGTVSHRRYGEHARAFQYPLFLTYLDLDELDRLPSYGRLWSVRRPAFSWYKRSDYLGRADVPLADAVRHVVARETGSAPSGPIRMLTNLRTAGFCFNPVTFYYCFGEDEQLEVIVAEINNTPWNERFRYVLDARRAELAERIFTLTKRFHVSPFQPMGLRYRWRFSSPGEELGVWMTSEDGSGPAFEASLELSRVELDFRAVAGALVRFPMMPAATIARIYGQAARLALRRAPFFTHPKKIDRQRRPMIPSPVEYPR